MIVPMKKVSLIILENKKKEALKKLRKLGVLHIEISEGKSSKLLELNEQIVLLQNSIYLVADKAKTQTEMKEAPISEVIEIAKEINSLFDERKLSVSETISLNAELERLKEWGEIDPSELSELADKGVEFSLCEMPAAEYEKLSDEVKTLLLNKTKHLARFVTVNSTEMISDNYKIDLPKISTKEIQQKIESVNAHINSIDEKITHLSSYFESMKKGIDTLNKETQFELYNSGMSNELLSSENNLSVCYFDGYIPTEDIESLKTVSKENSWGLIVTDPTEEDDVPTKLKNNKFVSLIYPLTDFLGTIPGYFEYDISSWFLGFILIFFGIIFGDGGYGLLITTVAGILIAKPLLAKKQVPPAFLLVGLLGLSTVIWGTVTCTWFGLSPEVLPTWLKSLSIPVISNVHADTIWYPFWTNGNAGLTTTQNVQIFCFSLALIQLTVAHIKGALRNRKSLKSLGDIGSILQLVGIFYVVLSLVVNAEVFSFGLVIAGIPVGTVAIALVGIGFVMSFIFANYEGSIIKSILSSLTNIVSVLLGVVNVFSDIVSYIRLWAVGLAGAAISTTVNELAGPLLGNFVFIIFAIILLVFGHGLNMILNILSVIVHGIRLNTLEFSSHLDMSWSGHKYKPFEE